MMGLGRSKIRRKVRQTGLPGEYFAGCYGKIRYEKEKAKERCLSTMNAYKCRYCNFWHVGRKNQKI